MQNKYFELAKKFKALAEQGEGGEAINAKKMLDRVMQKYGITPDDFDDDKKENHFFNISDADRTLFHQIKSKVNPDIKLYGRFSKAHIKEYGLKGDHLVECSVSDYVEIMTKYLFYRELYKKELDVFYYAFLMKNDLLVISNDESGDIDPDAMDKYMKALKMSKGIERGVFHKQLQKG